MPRSKDTNDSIRDDRKAQILAHALHLFVRKGLTATKMSDIASAAGISQGLAYHYYRSKEDIFVELIKNSYGKMTEAALGLKELPLTPKEKISLSAEKLLQGFAEGDSAALNFLLIIQASVFSTIPDEAKAIVQGRSLLREVIADIIREGQRDGAFKAYDADEMALLFWSSLTGIAIYRASLGDEFRTPDPKILIDMLVT